MSFFGDTVELFQHGSGQPCRRWERYEHPDGTVEVAEADHAMILRISKIKNGFLEERYDCNSKVYCMLGYNDGQRILVGMGETDRPEVHIKSHPSLFTTVVEIHRRSRRWTELDRRHHEFRLIRHLRELHPSGVVLNIQGNCDGSKGPDFRDKAHQIDHENEYPRIIALLRAAGELSPWFGPLANPALHTRKVHFTLKTRRPEVGARGCFDGVRFQILPGSYATWPFEIDDHPGIVHLLNTLIEDKSLEKVRQDVYRTVRIIDVATMQIAAQLLTGCQGSVNLWQFDPALSKPAI